MTYTSNLLCNQKQRYNSNWLQFHVNQIELYLCFSSVLESYCNNTNSYHTLIIIMFKYYNVTTTSMYLDTDVCPV